MELKAETGLIEAVLLLENEPLDIKTLMKITRLSRDMVEKAMDVLKEEYSRDIHGTEIIEIGGGYSFSPKQKYWDFLKYRYGKKNDRKLSRAALETLAIIAYSQPITKAEIENIRGVSADSMIRLLLNQELIRDVGKKDLPGKPTLYGTTKEFLKIFRLGSISDLPKLSDTDEEKFSEQE